MNEVNMDQLLIQMRAMADKASHINETAITEGNKPDFSNVFKNVVDQVNSSQKASGELQAQFQMGNTDVDSTDVMIKSQVASVSFQAMTQVRNRLVSAYQEIMNMSV